MRLPHQCRQYSLHCAPRTAHGKDSDALTLTVWQGIQEESTIGARRCPSARRCEGCARRSARRRTRSSPGTSLSSRPPEEIAGAVVEFIRYENLAGPVMVIWTGEPSRLLDPDLRL
jgi:hypothetical protein